MGYPFALVAEEVDAAYDIEGLNARNAGLVKSSQDIADDKSCAQNLNIRTLQFGRLKGWASVLLKRKSLAHKDKIDIAGNKHTARNRPD